MKRVNFFLSYTQKLYEIIKFYKYKFHDETYSNVQELEKILDNENFNIIINSDEETILFSIQKVLIDIINEIFSEMNEYSNEQKNNLKFIFISLTDEIIIKEIKESELYIWNELLLEKHFFGTAISGEKTINIIKEHNEYHSNKNNAMSIIHYLVFCCGFTGIYKNDTEQIEKLKNNIFQVLKNDFNIQNISETTHIDTCSYEILKGPNFARMLNYKNIYLNLLIMILFIESVYVGYLIFRYFQLKLTV